MSDHLLRFIPEDPTFVPARAAQEAAHQYTREVLDQADEITAQVTESVEFVDAGCNFESLSCPLCAADLDIDWWTGAMERAFMGEHPDLDVDTLCCNGRTSLHDLGYDAPQGFARFVLEAMNADVAELPDGLLTELERILACKLRVIRARY